jgi:hypothetical protein
MLLDPCMDLEVLGQIMSFRADHVARSPRKF